MKSKILALISLVMLVNLATAQETQETPWKFGGIGALNASQVSFTNWASGGVNSVGGNVFVSFFANYKEGKSTWDNKLDLGYGKLRQGRDKNTLFYKTDDKIDFTSNYGREAFDHWYYSALVGFKTQFDKGYKTANLEDQKSPISRFMAPAYLNLSIGMDYKFEDKLKVLISPLSGKVTFVTDPTLSNSGAFGVKPGENMRKEFGGYVRVEYKENLMTNIVYFSKLELFSNYVTKPQNIDVNWENSLGFKINNYFSANISFTMIYDDDIKIAYDSNNNGIIDATDAKVAKLQIKELIGIGLTYQF